MNQKEKNELYSGHVDEVWKREADNNKSLDKYILTLSMATLGFYITIIKFNNKEINHKYIR